MPALTVHKPINGFTEYKVTNDSARSGILWATSFLASYAVLWFGRYSAWLQAASCSAGLISACCWAFSTEYESVTLIKGLVLQLQSRQRCGLSSTTCYDLEHVQDAIICEHVTTTNVHYYLAFKMTGRQDMVVAYQSLLPRLAVIQPVYQSLLQDLLPAAVIVAGATVTKAV